MRPKASQNAGGKGALPRWWRAASLGVEFAASVAAVALLGYWIFGYWGAARRGMLIGATIGCIVGFYNFLRQAQKLLDAHASAASIKGPEPDDDDSKDGQ